MPLNSVTSDRNVLRIAREQGLKPVEGIVNTQKDTLLPPASVDLVFLSDTYHHFEHPQAMLQSIHRALRTVGTVVVIDFQKHGHSSDWINEHVRAGREAVIKKIEAVGFRLVGGVSGKELLFVLCP